MFEEAAKSAGDGAVGGGFGGVGVVACVGCVDECLVADVVGILQRAVGVVVDLVLESGGEVAVAQVAASVACDVG